MALLGIGSFEYKDFGESKFTDPESAIRRRERDLLRHVDDAPALALALSFLVPLASSSSARRGRHVCNGARVAGGGAARRIKVLSTPNAFYVEDEKYTFMNNYCCHAQ